jgi:hypothetical protein
MAKLDCPCGFQHNLTSDEHSFVIVPQKHYAKLLEAEKAAAKLDIRETDYMQRARELNLKVLSLKGRLCECPRCGRLAWFRQDMTSPTVYWLDE